LPAATIPDPVWYVPVPHSLQSESASWPVRSRYVPALHRSHVVFLASAVEYVPMPHSTQSASDLDWQLWQPWYRLYLPAGHDRHAPPLSP